MRSKWDKHDSNHLDKITDLLYLDGGRFLIDYCRNKALTALEQFKLRLKPVQLRALI